MKPEANRAHWKPDTARRLLSIATTLGPPPMADLGGGRFGMFGADYFPDELINTNDFNDWLPVTKAFAMGYQQTDGGFDAGVLSRLPVDLRCRPLVMRTADKSTQEDCTSTVLRPIL